ncbi:hypothetical protein PybrP1_002040 [[Pythium] brassicae (nom. inval.)]|nr:hypothetical protein PybrP1_002040 [[Pythium] brassicae (nom. inval.)]
MSGQREHDTKATVGSMKMYLPDGENPTLSSFSESTVSRYVARTSADCVEEAVACCGAKRSHPPFQFALLSRPISQHHFLKQRNTRKRPFVKTSTQ